MTVFAAVLAGGSTNSTSTINDVEPGLLGFLVVAALGLALVFLLRSMNKQFRKLGPKPEGEDAEAAGASAGVDGPRSAAAPRKPLRGLALRNAMAEAAEREAAEAAKRD